MRENDSGRFNIAGIGEVLWDVLEDSEELGGAPINFAYHAGALGANGFAISSVGDDRRGERALDELRTRNVSTAHISVLPGATTGYVLARIDAEGVASYQFPDDVAWDRIEFSADTSLLAAKLDCICFGSLAQRSEHSRRMIMQYLRTVKPDCLKVFDLNLRQDFYSEEIIRASLEVADVLKLNDDEIGCLAEMEKLAGGPNEQLRQLVRMYGLQLAVLTRGGAGSLLVTIDQMSDHPGYQADVVDTIGAGDSFTAATALGLLSGHELARINEHANRVAAFVCSQRGAMPRLPAEFRVA